VKDGVGAVVVGGLVAGGSVIGTLVGGTDGESEVETMEVFPLETDVGGIVGMITGGGVVGSGQGIVRIETGAEVVGGAKDEGATTSDGGSGNSLVGVTVDGASVGDSVGVSVGYSNGEADGSISRRR
jgi:hypothetical protein